MRADYEIRLNRKRFEDAVRWPYGKRPTKSMIKNADKETLLRGKTDGIFVETPLGQLYDLPGVGKWNGTIAVSAISLARLATKMGREKSVTLTYVLGGLLVNRTRIEARKFVDQR